jgi:ATP-binding cassette subfamily B protein
MPRDLKLLLNLLATRKRYYALGMVALAVADTGQLASAHLVGRAIDALQAGTMDRSLLARYAAAILALGLMVALARFVWRNLIFGSSRVIEQALRQRLHDHLLTLSPRFFLGRKVGELMAYATNDIQAIQVAAANGMMAALDAGIVLVGALFMMVWTVDLGLGLAAMAPLLLVSPLTFWLGRRLHEAYGEVQLGFAQLSDLAQENVAGMRVVKGFAREPVWEARFAEGGENYRRSYVHMLRYDAAFEPVVGALAGIGFTIGLGYGGLLVVEGAISLGAYVAFNTFLAMLLWPMYATGFTVNRFQRAMASVSRLQELFDSLPEIVDAADARALPEPRGELRAQALSFRYVAESPLALDDLSFHLPAGGSLGIIGRTGSGKSTLASLLLRQFEPPAGGLFLDGHDLRDIRLADLRRAVAYVPQDAFLFSDSIAANIAFDPDADPSDHEAVVAAAKLAGIHDEILSFPEGYDTLLGERGVTLSGGQRQRVGLARALLRRAPILLLDDALSAVDTETEARVLEALRGVAAGRSTIVIAHRVSAVRHADEILVLEEGRVIERGDHRALLDHAGYYARLYRKQQFEISLRSGAEEAEALDGIVEARDRR